MMVRLGEKMDAEYQRAHRENAVRVLGRLFSGAAPQAGLPPPDRTPGLLRFASTKQGV
ncbi:MAG: hypothetical protein R3F11_22105 [Verrucomicrobiales bacterium]